MGRRVDATAQRDDVAAVRARIERWRETRVCDGDPHNGFAREQTAVGGDCDGVGDCGDGGRLTHLQVAWQSGSERVGVAVTSSTDAGRAGSQLTRLTTAGPLAPGRGAGSWRCCSQTRRRR